MGYINKINVNNSTHLIEPTLYIIPTAPAENSTTYTATLDNFELVRGVAINVIFAADVVAGAKLNINNVANQDINIYYNGAAVISGTLKADHVYTMIYNGTNWIVVGDLATDTAIELVDMMEAT